MINAHNAGVLYVAGPGAWFKLTNKETQEYFRENQKDLTVSLEWCKSWGQKTNGLVPFSMQVALHFLFTKEAKAAGEHYLKILLKGINIEQNQVVGDIREQLLRDSMRKERKLSNKVRIFSIVKGFNDYVKGIREGNVNHYIWDAEKDPGVVFVKPFG
jgi:hypothetical protein